MSVTAQARMTAEEFVAWSMEQPDGTHYELEDGCVVTLESERTRHGETKALLVASAIIAIRERNLPCVVFTDSTSVRIDRHTVFEPDMVIRCGKRLPGDTVIIDDPLAVFEVLSPSTQSRDNWVKLLGYLSISTVRHYVVVDALKGVVIHHTPGEGGKILSTIIHDGRIVLDPPGIVLADFLPPPDEVDAT